MYDQERLDRSLEKLSSLLNGRAPRMGLVLGSGWGEVADALQADITIPFGEIEALGRAGVEGHAGRILAGKVGSTELLIFQGRRHWYEGEGWTPIVAPLYFLKQLGARAVMLTNAAGGINSGFSAGDLMLIRDHINLMGEHPLRGRHNPDWGVRFPDMSAAYDPRLRELMQQCAAEAGIKLQSGVYCGLSGPSFETPAEIKMLKTVGADAVGMSTVPEAIVARSLGLRVLGLSCISNLAAGISAHPLTHEEVGETSARVMGTIKVLILSFLKALKDEHFRDI